MAIRRKRRREVGAFLLRRPDGQLFFVARGYQAKRLREVKFRVSPSMVLKMAGEMLRAMIPHAKACPGCSEDVADILDEIDDVIDSEPDEKVDTKELN